MKKVHFQAHGVKCPTSPHWNQNNKRDKNPQENDSIRDQFCIHTLSKMDAGFPKQLKEIPQAPHTLHVMGENPIPEKRCVAIVGTRIPSKWGLEFVERLVPLLVREGVIIVSGLALGIDTHAHRVCLAEKGTTIAVMPCGFDRIYPRQNERLAQKILSSGGALVSEYAPHASLSKQNFIQRNRLITGLSAATIFVQGKGKGGSMHSAVASILQERALFSPFPPAQECHEPHNQGNMTLLQLKGSQFKEQINAKGKLGCVLSGKFGQISVAHPLNSRRDLDVLFEHIEKFDRESCSSQDVAFTQLSLFQNPK